LQTLGRRDDVEWGIRQRVREAQADGVSQMLRLGIGIKRREGQHRDRQARKRMHHRRLLGHRFAGRHQPNQEAQTDSERERRRQRTTVPKHKPVAGLHAIKRRGGGCRHGGGRWGFAQPVTHPGNGLQRKPAMGFRKAANAGGAPIDGVVAYRTAAPAG
jgi:hypothetical protein